MKNIENYRLSSFIFETLLCKFLQNYHKYYLDHTMNYKIYVANYCKHGFLFDFYIEVFNRNPLKF